MDNQNEIIPLTNKEIADQLNVTINTVKNYKARKFLPQSCGQNDVEKRLAKVKEIYNTVRSQNGKYAIASYRNNKHSDNPVQEVIKEERQIDLI